MLLQNRNVVVTGAAAGIGLAIAERMVEEGANVVLADIDQARGEAQAERLNTGAGKAWFVRFDAADVQSIDAMTAAAIDLTGGVDALVNNAGVTRRIGILDITPQDWDWIQSINTRGLFFCLQRFAAHMRDRNGGRIVNIASISGKGVRGVSNASYAASKAAAIVVARVAAAELGRYNINVNSVCPGLTRTELLERIEKSNPQIIEDMKNSSVLGRICETTDIANAVVFLCSDMAANITGQSLNVDSGLVWD